MPRCAFCFEKGNWAIGVLGMNVEGMTLLKFSILPFCLIVRIGGPDNE